MKINMYIDFRVDTKEEARPIIEEIKRVMDGKAAKVRAIVEDEEIIEYTKTP